MAYTRRRNIILPDKVYQHLKVLKWERQKELGRDRYSYGDFIEYLCRLYEQELELTQRIPNIGDIQELEN